MRARSSRLSSAARRTSCASATWRSARRSTTQLGLGRDSSAGILIRVPTRHWRARLDGSYEDYLGRRSAKTRANLRRYGRKFEAAFPDAIELRIFRDPADLDRLLATTRAVYGDDLPERLGRRLLRLGSRAGDDDLHRSHAAGSAGSSSTSTARRARSGTGSATVASSPPARPATIPLSGATVWARTCSGRMVEELSREDGLEWIDFGFGDAEYKRHFGDESWLEEDVFVWARRPRAIRLNATRTALLAADRSATVRSSRAAACSSGRDVCGETRVTEGGRDQPDAPGREGDLGHLLAALRSLLLMLGGASRARLSTGRRRRSRARSRSTRRGETVWRIVTDFEGYAPLEPPHHEREGRRTPRRGRSRSTSSRPRSDGPGRSRPRSPSSGRIASSPWIVAPTRARGSPTASTR